MGLQSKFLTFNSNIYITRQSEEYKNAREKDDSITEDIRKNFEKMAIPSKKISSKVL